MDLREPTPLTDFLVIKNDIWFRQEPGETSCDPKFFGDPTRGVRAAGTPTVEDCPLGKQCGNVLGNSTDRNAFCASRADKSVVDVDVNDEAC